MEFKEAIEHVFSNYAVFKGRARRSEYWYFQLFNYLVLMGLGLFSFVGVGILLVPLYLLGSMIPNLAVSWRRLHDVGMSGWWYLISLIPIVGTILMVIWMAQDGQPGANQFGPNPKGVGTMGMGGGMGGNPYAAASVRGSLAVQCIAGPLQGQTFSIRGDELLFGREPSCGVRMPDGTPGISRRHCCIRWQQGMPVLIDLGSRYGTFLADGKQLPPNYPEPVAAGTRFYLGNQGNMFQIIVF